jgi:hypothetical protein
MSATSALAMGFSQQLRLMPYLFAMRTVLTQPTNASSISARSGWAHIRHWYSCRPRLTGFLPLSLATRKPSFSDEEVDALVVYEGSFRVAARMTPDYHDLEDLAIYKLDREVYVAIYGEIVPMHLNPAAERGTAASFAFQHRFHREPVAGEVLHFSDVKACHIEEVDFMRVFVEVWNRRVTNLSCPFRVEEDKILRRLKPNRPDQEPYWEEDYRTAE